MQRALSLVLLLSFTSAADAATSKSKRVKPSQIKSTTVSIKGKSYAVACLGNTTGKTTKKKKDLFFLSFSDEKKELSKRKSKTKSVKTRLTLLSSLDKSGKTACKNIGKLPEHLSLDKYSGPFGYEEAQILYNRFGFGGTRAQLEEAAHIGLDATVAKLTTLISEPQLEATIADIECDGWKLDDPDAGNANRVCDGSNVNTMNRFGLRTGLLYRFINSQNAFFNRFMFWLMDERMAVSASAARDCERHAIRTYITSVWRAAITGNYRNYMIDMNNDHLMHLRSLDGGTNRGGLAVTPNENYAREFWELGTVAPTDLAGKPVYSDLDIANAALAFTGWNIDDLNVNSNNICLASYVPLFHTQGPKTIFAGSPYQATVTNADDLLAVTFNHPRTAEHLAEDLWKEFVNLQATPDAIRQLATLIRDNNYNLIPVFRKLMVSKALFAGQSRGALIKHPLEMVVGFVKATGFPLYYRHYDTLMNRLEQTVLNPATVFGWDTKYLSGQQLQIEWWNTFVDYFINFDPEDMKDETGYSYYDRFVWELYATNRRTSLDLVDRVARDLGVPINAAQRATLDEMMNFYLTRYGCPSQCGGQSYRLVRELYDMDPNADESKNDWGGQRRLRMLITALMELPAARTK